MSANPALLDTSVLVAGETRRPLDLGALPEETAVCVVTIAELQLGVLAAGDTSTRASRLASLEAASTVEPLPITADVARRWAELRMRLAEEGRRANVNNLWIAAVAQTHDMDVVTQDEDFEVIAGVGGPSVIRV